MMCDSMYDKDGQEKVMSTALNVDSTGSAAEGDASPDIRLVTESTDQFDLYEWALEFSAAAGFEVERVQPRRTN